MSNVLIIGAGIGGVTAAYELRDKLECKAHKITVVDEKTSFDFTPSNPWVGVGWRTRKQTSVDIGPQFQKKDIDSFFTASGKSCFKRRLVVDTTKGEWSQNADDALERQSIPINRISLSDLESSRIDWSVYAQSENVVLFEKKSLRPHQEEALVKVKEGLSGSDRGKLVMACGTGKTFTSI